MITDLKKFFKTSIIYAAAQIIIQAMNFFLLPVYTNSLGTAEYGRLSTITAFTGLFSTVLIMSIQSGVCRFYREEEDKNRLISTALNFAYVLCIFWCCIILVAGRPLSELIFDFKGSNEGYAVLWITAAASMLNQIISIYISRYSMEYKAFRVVLFQVVQTALQFFIIIILVLKMNMGLMGVLYGQLLSAAVIFIILSCQERNSYRFTIIPEGLKNMLIFSAGLLPVNISGWILTLSDRYFIKYYLGLADTGIYNLGYQFGMLINPIFITPFLNSFTAYKFEVYKNEDASDKFKKLFRKYNTLGCFLMLFIAIYSKFAVMIFANIDFLDAYKVVPIILYSYFLYGKTGYYALGFQLKNKTWKIGLYMLFASAMNIALNFILVPRAGIYGAALSTLAAYLILDLMFILSSNKYYKIDLDIKFQLSAQSITLFIYGIYYIFSIYCTSIWLEFMVNLIIIYLFIIIFIKAGLVGDDIKKIAIKTVGILKKKLVNWFVRFRDLHGEEAFSMNKEIHNSHIDINHLDISKIDKELLSLNCENYLEHKFKLLGSKWVKVSYDMHCEGLEGFVYDGSLHIRDFDREGRWLEAVLRKGNLKTAKKIWRGMDNNYIPIDWQMDFKSGYRYSQQKWYLDQKIGPKPGVDIKVPWELSRLQHLNCFAISALTFPEKRQQLLQEFKNQVLDFIMANPMKMGVAWTCTMDTAIRAANLLVSYDILSQIDEYNILDESFRGNLGKSIYEHGCFIINNLEVNERFNGNHYLSDIAGLLFISAYLKKDLDTEKWLEFSVHEMLFQGLKQFYADGSNFEASTSYHRLSGELLCYSLALIIGLTGRDALPEILLKRLYRAAKFSLDITNQNGTTAQVGDNDSGRFFKFSPERNILNHDSFISAVNGIFEADSLAARDNYPLEKSIVKTLRNCCGTYTAAIDPFKAAAPVHINHPKLCFSLKSEILYSSYTRENIDISGIDEFFYPFFGLYIFKSRNFHLSVMAGGIGQNGVGGHSHNDKLSFELSLGEREVCRDPGTYLYTPMPALRNKFRSVKVHNAPQVSKEEQCSFLDLFSMKAETECSVVKLHRNNPAFYLTFRDVKILREFIILEDRLIIMDKSNKALSVNLFADSISTGYGQLESMKLGGYHGAEGTS